MISVGKVMNRAIILFALLVLISNVNAITIDEALLNSTGLNTTVSISTQVNLSEFIVAADSIYFGKVNYSHPLQANTDESLSYNITTENKRYTALNLPYISQSNTAQKTIVSAIDGTVDGEMTIDVNSCYLDFLRFDFVGTTYDTVLNSSFWSCSANRMTFNYTGLGQGINYVWAVGDIVATNCTEGNVTLTFNIRDEDSPTTPLIADAEVDLNYWIGDASFYVRNFTLDYSGNSTYSICLSNNVTEIQADLYIKYTTDNGFTHRYILANNTLSVADVQTINIYNFNTTTDISDLRITTRQNSNYNYYPNVIAKLQRRYTAEGVWRTVQMDKSGDFGLVFFNIKEEIVDYRLIFTDMSNNILRTTETIKFSCTSAICDLTMLLNPYSATSGTSGLGITYSYSNDTSIVTVDWTDTLAGTNTVEFQARQNTITGLNYLCDETQTGAAGTMTCDLSGRSGIVEIHITGNGDIIFNDLLDLTTGKLGSIIGDSEGAIWAAIIMVTCVMFGLFSPVGAIIAMFIGLITIYMLGIFTPITITFVIIAGIIGIVIGFKVRN